MTTTRGLFFWEGSGLELGRANPYGALLAAALRRHGVELTEGNYEFGREWLEQSRAAYDVLHLNWLDRFYARFEEPRDADAASGRFADFTENLIHARRLGYRLIWTVHNLFPHERRYPHLDRLVNALVAREADHVIAHCRFAADSIETRYDPPRPVTVIPHGNYVPIFPNTVSRAQARERLAIDGTRLVARRHGAQLGNQAGAACVLAQDQHQHTVGRGGLAKRGDQVGHPLVTARIAEEQVYEARGYKGVADLVAAFRQTAATDSVLVLVLRENARSPGLIAELRAVAAGDERVRIHASRYFPADQFQYFLNAADVVVLPFTAVLTSGSAIQALGFGKPLIVPRLGCLPELASGGAGLLYDPDADGALAGALAAARSLDLDAARRAALQRTREFDWDPIAARIAALYRSAPVGSTS